MICLSDSSYIAHSTSSIFFSFKYPSTPEIYTLSLHDALPICGDIADALDGLADRLDRADRLFGRKLHVTDLAGRSEEHTSELQSRFDLVCRLLLEKKKKLLYPPKRRVRRLNRRQACQGTD